MPAVSAGRSCYYPGNLKSDMKPLLSDCSCVPDWCSEPTLAIELVIWRLCSDVAQTVWLNPDRRRGVQAKASLLAESQTPGAYLNWRALCGAGGDEPAPVSHHFAGTTLRSFRIEVGLPAGSLRA